MCVRAMKKVIEKIINNENLSEDEMRKTINTIMKGEATSCQIGGFLTALRAKGETIEEITGAVKGMRDNMLKLDMEGEFLIDTCGTGGDGGKTFNISTAVAIIAAAGVKVAKHGNRAVSSKSGSADVLEALGIKTDLSPEESIKQLKEYNMSFLFAQQYHKAMKNVGKERKELGTRTIFNLIGPLANPAPIKGQLMGLFDGDLVDKIGEVLVKLGIERGLVVHGEDGLDEITTTSSTKVCEICNGKTKVYKISPEDFGIEKVSIEEISGGTPEENAEIILSILKGEKGPKRDIVTLNAGAALFAGKKVDSINDGFVLTNALIDSGKAYKKYQQLKELVI